MYLCGRDFLRLPVPFFLSSTSEPLVWVIFSFTFNRHIILILFDCFCMWYIILYVCIPYSTILLFWKINHVFFFILLSNLFFKYTIYYVIFKYPLPIILYVRYMIFLAHLRVHLQLTWGTKCTISLRFSKSEGVIRFPFLEEFIQGFRSLLKFLLTF